MRTFTFSYIFLLLIGGGLSVHSAEPTPVKLTGVKVRPVDLKQVRLLDGPFKDSMDRARRYLLSLDIDRQLHTFRLAAGLPSNAEPLGGWETPGNTAVGEFFGHSLSARALMYAMTGDPEIKAQTDQLIAELVKCQAALGDNGYLFAMKETVFDQLEAGQCVPGNYYTIHKLLAGLMDVYVYCDNPQALEVAKKLGTWTYHRTEGQTAATMEKTWHPGLHFEFGGVNEALMNLYALTGDPNYLETGKRFDDEVLYGPLAKGEDELKGYHVNTLIPKILGAAREYEVTGNQRFRQIAEYFWREVVNARTYCTGGMSHYEWFRSDPGKLADQLGPNNQECCCTYNMLKLTRHVFEWTDDPQAADYYERALFNGVLGTQRQDGMMMYYVPLASGYWKTFCSPFDSFWCCVGTGCESFSKLGDSIYWQDDDGLVVNLFIASELNWKEKGMRIRQETRFPEEQQTSFVVSTKEPVATALRIRVPYWATQGMKFKLNQSPLDIQTTPSSYAVIRRTWNDGDRLQVTIPMSLHAHPMPDDKSLMAMMYGPLVLVGRLGAAGLTPEVLDRPTPGPEGDPAPAPTLLAQSDDLNAWIEPVPGKPLEFRTVGQAANVTLAPFYKLFGERYAVYWRVYPKGSPEYQAVLDQQELLRKRQARTVDVVQIGDAESESSHALAGEHSKSGIGAENRPWRDTSSDGGWFSYRMKVLPDQPMTALCTFWGSETGARCFDILVDGQKIATMDLSQNRIDKFFDASHPIPPELTQSKDCVTVRFQGQSGNITGGVFGLRILKPE